MGGTPFVTWTLLAINVILWLAMEIAGSSKSNDVLRDFGALSSPLIANGDYWRLFTAMFLHVGLMHLLLNGFMLLIFGRLVEGIYGHVRFSVIYVVAGLAGSVVSFINLNPDAVGAGASGAILGIIGALAAYFAARRDVLGEFGRQTLSGLMLIAVIELLFGFMNPAIDNWAHMGGLAAGFGVGLGIVPNYRPRPAMGPVVIPSPIMRRPMVDTNSFARRWWVVPAATAVLAAGTWLGTATLPDNAGSRIYKAQDLFEKRRFDEAWNELLVARDLAVKTRNFEALVAIERLLLAIRLSN